MNLPWSKRRLRQLSGRAKHATVEIAERIRGRCTHEPLTDEQEADLAEELRAALADDESSPLGEGSDVSQPAALRPSESARQLGRAPQPAVVWGQYLDDYHYSEAQWGIYGTSASLQILALQAARRGDHPTDEEQVSAALPMPQSVTAPDKRLEKKVAKGDLANVVKLAFVADALHLGEADVGVGEEPPLIEQIIDLAVDDHHFWSSRLPGDRLRVNRDHEFPTAVVLLALKRYEFFRRHRMWRKVRPWLARKVTTTDGLKTPTMYALTGLALLPDDGQNAQITEALKKIDAFLLSWSRTQRDVVLSRPVYNEFIVGNNHDYLFLHPELLAALYFLLRGPGTDAAPFVLRVVDAVCTNVEGHQGAFEGQPRVVSTVDQLWVVRLLDEFVAQYDAPGGPRRLLPPWRFVPFRLRRFLRSRWVRSASFVFLIGVILIGIELLTGWSHQAVEAFAFALIAAAIVALAGATIQVIRRREG